MLSYLKKTFQLNALNSWNVDINLIKRGGWGGGGGGGGGREDREQNGSLDQILRN